MLKIIGFCTLIAATWFLAQQPGALGHIEAFAVDVYTAAVTDFGPVVAQVVKRAEERQQQQPAATSYTPAPMAAPMYQQVPTMGQDADQPPTPRPAPRPEVQGLLEMHDVAVGD